MARTSSHRRRGGRAKSAPWAIGSAAAAALCAVAYFTGPLAHRSGATEPLAGAGSTSATPTTVTPTPSAPPSASAASTHRARPKPKASHSAARRAAAGPAGDLGACSVAPADSIWRTPVNGLPLLSRSAAYVASIGTSSHVHADFGSGTWEGAPFGIPVTKVPAGTPAARVSFDYADESDRGPYEIPSDALIEGGSGADGDRHVIAVDTATCRSYELWNAHPLGGGAWHAGSGAVFPLTSNALRPDGWTSADAAGLPILPGLARYDEAARGVIDHALRITVPRSQSAHLWPARHDAGSSDSSLPPMGLRLRLKAGVNVSGLPAQARAVARALQTYGAIVADNGSAWYVSGTQDDRWSNDQLQSLGTLTGADFEAVDTSSLRVSAGSGAARQP